MGRETGQRQDLFLAHLVVDGRDCGYWDSHEGGDYEVSGSSTRVSGGKRVSLGGQVEVSSIKITRLHRQSTRDTWDFLRSRAGKGEATVTLQEKDLNGVPFGKPIVHVGTLGTIPNLAYDENSSDKSTEEVNVDVDHA